VKLQILNRGQSNLAFFTLSIIDASQRATQGEDQASTDRKLLKPLSVENGGSNPRKGEREYASAPRMKRNLREFQNQRSCSFLSIRDYSRFLFIV